MGVDVVGPFPRAQSQLRFLLVATDYFTKWVKAVPLSEVTEQQIVKFLSQNIVCRFGLSHTIIFDNEMNFASKQVASFCAKYKTHIDSLRLIILKATATLKLATISSSITCAKVWTKLNINGQRTPQSAFGLQDNQMCSDR